MTTTNQDQTVLSAHLFRDGVLGSNNTLFMKKGKVMPEEGVSSEQAWPDSPFQLRAYTNKEGKSHIAITDNSQVVPADICTMVKRDKKADGSNFVDKNGEEYQYYFGRSSQPGIVYRALVYTGQKIILHKVKQEAQASESDSAADSALEA